MPDPSVDRTILVVEDSIDLRELFIRALKSEHFNVITAADGAEALQALADGLRPNLILFDLKMPGMGGEDFLSHLRKNLEYGKTPAIVISGAENLATLAKEIGADGFIKKPVDLASLYREVAKHANR